jgi:hypothetical protein
MTATQRGRGLFGREALLHEAGEGQRSELGPESREPEPETTPEAETALRTTRPTTDREGYVSFRRGVSHILLLLNNP